MIRQYIASQLSIILQEWVEFTELPPIETPDSGYGDLASTVAFTLAKSLRKAPALIAQELAARWNDRYSYIGTAQSVNGFWNLTVDDQWLWEHRLNLQTPKFLLKPKRILLEFVSPNPTGPLHIGHGRWAVLGSTLATMLRAVGHQVDTECYVNDAGVQIKKLLESVNAVKLNQPIPEDGYHGEYIRELAQLNDHPVTVILAQQQRVLSALGTPFDDWFLESTLHQGSVIPDAIQALQQTGAVYELDGALWFRSTLWGDDKDRVLIKSDGNLTYFAVDVAYHQHKLSRSYDTLINIWGADHHGYVPRVRAAIQALAPQHSTEFTVLIGQLVSVLKEGQPVRMSKRSGTMVVLEDILDEVGCDALRFMLLTKSADTPLEFDLSLLTQLTMENPLYYVQYAHARLSTMLRRAGDGPMGDQITGFSTTERRLVLYCLQWGDELGRAAELLLPNRLTQYALELARLCHAAYETSPFLTATGEDWFRRKGVFEMAQKQLATVLAMMGISAPDSM